MQSIPGCFNNKKAVGQSIQLRNKLTQTNMFFNLILKDLTVPALLI